MASIDGVHLPDNLIWVDEFSTTQVAASHTRSLTGALIVQTSLKLAGRSIVLDGQAGGWVTHTQLTALRLLLEVNPDKTFILDYRGITQDVIQNASTGPALTSTAIVDYETPTAEDYYWINLKLLTI